MSTPVDPAAVILRLCAARGPHKSICPSEAARALAEDWRGAMPAVRAAAIRLASSGAIVATQRGAPVDPATARGPIRLRIRSDADQARQTGFAGGGERHDA